MTGDYEAVQFRDWAPWHAIRPENDNRTFCGFNAITAKRMWEPWSEKLDRCERCQAATEKRGEP